MRRVSPSRIKSYDSLFTALTNLCLQLRSIKDFEICRGPFTISGDTYTMNLSVLSLKGDTVWNSNPKFNVYGGFRMNFSTGLSFSTLANQSFFKEKQTDSTFAVRKGNTNNWFLPSITAFIHFYWKGTGKKQSAGTFGLSTSTTSISTTNYYLGYSWILGIDRRFIFTVGVSGAAVDRLKARFIKDNVYKYSEFTGVQDQDFVEQRMRIGGFLGVSYNLSSKR
jgi:hypothetical protein